MSITFEVAATLRSFSFTWARRKIRRGLPAIDTKRRKGKPPSPVASGKILTGLRESSSFELTTARGAVVGRVPPAPFQRVLYLFCKFITILGRVSITKMKYLSTCYTFCPLERAQCTLKEGRSRLSCNFFSLNHFFYKLFYSLH